MKQLLLVLIFAVLPHITVGAGDWCYQSQFSCSVQCSTPNDWSKISAKCGEKKQSPINIVTRKTVHDSKLNSFTFENYDISNTAIIKNNGHTVQVDLAANIMISGGRLEGKYKALQLHLHWGNDAGPGSEHTVDGEQYPMELHIVHMKRNYTDITQALTDPTGVAVLGFMYEEAAQDNIKYKPLIDALLKVKDKGTDSTIPNMKLTDLILTKDNLANYFRYEGSLTTPRVIKLWSGRFWKKRFLSAKHSFLLFTETLLQTKQNNEGNVSTCSASARPHCVLVWEQRYLCQHFSTISLCYMCPWIVILASL
ncbi:carbonic anhydrase 4-like, partial [Acipenser oxyrinchus oxyrinchus]